MATFTKERTTHPPTRDEGNVAVCDIDPLDRALHLPKQVSGLDDLHHVLSVDMTVVHNQALEILTKIWDFREALLQAGAFEQPFDLFGQR